MWPDPEVHLQPRSCTFATKDSQIYRQRSDQKGRIAQLTLPFGDLKVGSGVM